MTTARPRGGSRATIYQVAVTRTLVDGGSGLNVLSMEAFSLLHVPLERL